MLESSSFSFPASPTINQTYDFQGLTFVWTGVYWKQVNPAFELGEVSGLDLLVFGSANNVASVDFILTSWTAKYRAFTIKFVWIHVTDNVRSRFTTSTDGGATFDGGVSDYDSLLVGGNDTPAALISGQPAAAFIQTQGPGNGTNEGRVGSLDILKPTSAALWARLIYTEYQIDAVATPGGNAIFGGGAREAAADIDAVRFATASGNILSLDYALYGWT